MNAALPTDEQRRRAEWARLNAQIERWRKQARGLTRCSRCCASAHG
jgi:hypothetical protein